MTQILKVTRKKSRVLDVEIGRLDDLEKQSKGLREITEMKAKGLKEITEIIEGLRRTQEDSKREDYYEGKYYPSYKYVERIEEDEIVTTEDFKPGMMHSCPDCGSETPVIRYYYQEYDSPEEDIWVTKALAICCDKIYELKKFVRN